MKYANKSNRFLLTALLLIVIIFLLVGLTACTTKKKVVSKTTSNASNVFKCSTDANCVNPMSKVIALNKTTKNCMQAYCAAGVCKTRLLENCCGNGIAETMENNLTGSKCTCPADYGACNVTIKYEDANGRMVTPKYIYNGCKDDNCQVLYDDASQRNSEFFTIWTGVGFTMNIYVRYPNPFYRDDSIMQVEMKLTDYDETKMKPPVIINEMRLMEGTKILFRNNPGKASFQIDQSIKNDLIMDYYDFVYPEEAKTVFLSIDYEYIPLKVVINKDRSTSYVELPIERKTYTIQLRDRITFLDKTLIK